MASSGSIPSADAAARAPTGLRPRPGRLPRFRLILLTALGGALGSLARFGINALLPWDSAGFPWATVAENLTGSFLLGWLLVYLLNRRDDAADARAFFATGLLGSFTTFSALIGEGMILSEQFPVTAGVYVAISLVGGLLCAALGFRLGRILHASGAEPAHSDTAPGRGGSHP